MLVNMCLIDTMYTHTDHIHLSKGLCQVGGRYTDCSYTWIPFLQISTWRNKDLTMHPLRVYLMSYFVVFLSGLLPDVPHFIINIYFVLKSLNLSSVIQFHSSQLELARLRDSHTTECALQIEMCETRQRELNCHSSHPPGWRCLRFTYVLAAITLNWADFILSPRQSASSLISADSFPHCSWFATWVGLSLPHPLYSSAD